MKFHVKVGDEELWVEDMGDEIRIWYHEKEMMNQSIICSKKVFGRFLFEIRK